MANGFADESDIFAPLRPFGWLLAAAAQDMLCVIKTKSNIATRTKTPRTNGRRRSASGLPGSTTGVAGVVQV